MVCLLYPTQENSPPLSKVSWYLYFEYFRTLTSSLAFPFLCWPSLLAGVCFYSPFFLMRCPACGQHELSSRLQPPVNMEPVENKIWKWFLSVMQQHWHYNSVLYSPRRLSVGRSRVQDSEIDRGWRNERDGEKDSVDGARGRGMGQSCKFKNVKSEPGIKHFFQILLLLFSSKNFDRINISVQRKKIALVLYI